MGAGDASERKALTVLTDDATLKTNPEYWEIGRREYTLLRRFLEQYAPHLRHPRSWDEYLKSCRQVELDERAARHRPAFAAVIARPKDSINRCVQAVADTVWAVDLPSPWNHYLASCAERDEQPAKADEPGLDLFGVKQSTHCQDRPEPAGQLTGDVRTDSWRCASVQPDCHSVGHATTAPRATTAAKPRPSGPPATDTSAFSAEPSGTPRPGRGPVPRGRAARST